MEPPSKRKKRCASYRPEMTEKYPCLVKSSKGTGYIYCTVCFSDFMVDSGINDCTRHVEGPKHVKNVKSISSMKSVTTFATTSSNHLMEAVTNAEVLFTGFLVEHNIPLAASDHVAKLFKAMFLNKDVPANQIISKYACGRTKSTHIVEKLARTEISKLTAAMKTGPYSIATDASNDRHDKLYPLVIRLAINCDVKTLLLSIIEVDGKNTGKKVADAIVEELSAKGISLDNCIAFTSDNANVMIGKKSGCYGELTKHNEQLISTGCICHRLHLAAEWAGKQLPVNVEQFFIDIYYYIEKSSCRLKAFKDYQEECGVKQSQLCKHAPTRWLSLSKTCHWVLEQWVALERFFEEECRDANEQAKCLDAEEQKQDRKRKVLENLRSRTMKAYVTYLSFILPEFDKVNMQLQSETSMIHIQRRLMERFIRTLMTMLLKPSALAHKVVDEVDFKSAYNIKNDHELMIGDNTKAALEKLSSDRIKLFFPSIKKFLQTAITYLLKHSQLSDDYLRHAQVADINVRETSSWKNLEYFLNAFPSILPHGASRDDLQMQFAEFQSCLLPEDLPNAIDEKWKAISDNVKDLAGKPCLRELAAVMCHILAIPHSNAACERIFSTVRKNRTDFRASMSSQTLENILIVKQKNEVCYERQNSSELLKSCKAATARALAEKQQ